MNYVFQVKIFSIAAAPDWNCRLCELKRVLLIGPSVALENHVNEGV